MISDTCHCGANVTASTSLALNAAMAFHKLVAHGVQPAVEVVANIAKVAVQFGSPMEVTNMNGIMTLTQKEPFFVDGFNADGSVGVLAPGQTVLISIDNSAIASISPDAVPGKDPSGVQSIASGIAVAVAVGTTNLTATVVNADTSKGATVTVLVTVTAVVVTPGVTSLTVVFGAPVAQ